MSAAFLRTDAAAARPGMAYRWSSCFLLAGSLDLLGTSAFATVIPPIAVTLTTESEIQSGVPLLVQVVVRSADLPEGTLTLIAPEGSWRITDGPASWSGTLLPEPPIDWQIVINGPRIDVYGDGKLLLSVADWTYRGGHFGLWSWSRQVVALADVRFEGKCPPPSPGPTLQLPGDCNQDSRVDLSDAICVFGHLFQGSPRELPCQGGTSADPGNVALLDHNRDGAIDLSDGIALLTYLFQGTSPPALGTECAAIATCPNVCLPR